MKKTFAFLSVLLMASSCMTLSASAAWQEVVVAVNDDPSQWVTKCGQFCYYVDSKKIADFHPSQESFEYGDIIELENILIGMDELAVALPDGTPIDRHEITNGSYSYAIYQNQPYSITKVGSIFDHPVTEQFTVAEKWENSKLILTDDEGSQYRYNIDYLYRGYYQPDCVDLSTLQTGDIVSCITYDGIPMLVTEKLSGTSLASSKPEQITPSGDANNDGQINILDVITINRVVLGKEILEEDQFYHADLNQDGVVDATDSLMMLKKLVGLE